MGEKNIDERVVEAFGHEWSAYDRALPPEAEHRRLFEEYFSIFPFDDLTPGAEGFDAVAFTTPDAIPHAAEGLTAFLAAKPLSIPTGKRAAGGREAPMAHDFGEIGKIVKVCLHHSIILTITLIVLLLERYDLILPTTTFSVASSCSS